MTKYQEWFESYAQKRRSEISSEEKAALDEVDMKIEHTRRVQARAEDIARWLNLPEAGFKIASLCGLFHDLGRFEQAACFATMDDKVTGSHADLSEKVFYRDAPKDNLTGREIELIALALRCHNLFKLPAGLTGETLLYAKLIRDADKLDIFRHYIDLHSQREKRIFRMVHFETFGEPSAELLAAAERGENINAEKVRNGADRMLLELSLVYDLNYGISFQHMLEMKFLECFAKHPAFLPAVDFAESYAAARIEQR